MKIHLDEWREQDDGAKASRVRVVVCVMHGWMDATEIDGTLCALASICQFSKLESAILVRMGQS